jgi:hypothetical protein
VDSAPRFTEGLVTYDDWKIEPGKVLAEAVDLQESWEVEPNLPIETQELLEVTEQWSVVPS